jgi:hypothetical protein
MRRREGKEPGGNEYSGTRADCDNSLHGDAINMGSVYDDQNVVVDDDLVTPGCLTGESSTS